MKTKFANLILASLLASLVITVSLICGTPAHGQSATVTNTVNVPVQVTVTTTTNIPNLLGDLKYGGIIQEIWDDTAGSTNFAVVAGAGRGMTGNKNLVFVDGVYNLSENAGLIIGYDNLFSNDKRLGASNASIVKGGLQLNATLKPLSRFGWTNFVVTPFAAYLVASPLGGTSNDGGVAQIALTGMDWESPQFWGIHAHIGGFYENRSGQGAWDGNYLCGHIAFSKGF